MKSDGDDCRFREPAISVNMETADARGRRTMCQFSMRVWRWKAREAQVMTITIEGRCTEARRYYSRCLRLCVTSRQREQITKRQNQPRHEEIERARARIREQVIVAKPEWVRARIREEVIVAKNQEIVTREEPGNSRARMATGK